MPNSLTSAAASGWPALPVKIARDAKTLILKLARAVSSTKAVDLSPLLDGMARAWDDGMAALDSVNEMR